MADIEKIVRELIKERDSALATAGRLDKAITALGTTGGTALVPLRGATSSRAKKAKRKPRRKMTAAEKKAASKRMKASWAKRKKAVSKKATKKTGK